MIKGYKFLVNEEEKSRILNLHKNRTSSQYLILEQDKRNLKFNNEGESSKKFTYMGGADLNYSTYYNKDEEGKYNGDIYQIYIYDSTLNSYGTNFGLYVYGKPQNGPPDPTEIKFNPNDKEFIKFQDILNQTKTKEEWDKLVQDSLDGVTPTITSNSQSSSSETTNTNSKGDNNSQTETKIEFQKPTDHKTALEQIKRELGVEQGYSISDAVLNFLRNNTPKN